MVYFVFFVVPTLALLLLLVLTHNILINIDHIPLWYKVFREFSKSKNFKEVKFGSIDGEAHIDRIVTEKFALDDLIFETRNIDIYRVVVTPRIIDSGGRIREYGGRDTNKILKRSNRLIEMYLRRRLHKKVRKLTAPMATAQHL